MKARRPRVLTPMSTRPLIHSSSRPTWLACLRKDASLSAKDTDAMAHLDLRLKVKNLPRAVRLMRNASCMSASCMLH